METTGTKRNDPDVGAVVDACNAGHLRPAVEVEVRKGLEEIISHQMLVDSGVEELKKSRKRRKREPMSSAGPRKPAAKVRRVARVQAPLPTSAGASPMNELKGRTEDERLRSGGKVGSFSFSIECPCLVETCLIDRSSC
jgi:hypothetical protein